MDSIRYISIPDNQYDTVRFVPVSSPLAIHFVRLPDQIDGVEMVVIRAVLEGESDGKPFREEWDICTTATEDDADQSVRSAARSFAYQWNATEGGGIIIILNDSDY